MFHYDVSYVGGCIELTVTISELGGYFKSYFQGKGGGGESIIRRGAPGGGGGHLGI